MDIHTLLKPECFRRLDLYEPGKSQEVKKIGRVLPLLMGMGAYLAMSVYMVIIAL